MDDKHPPPAAAPDDKPQPGAATTPRHKAKPQWNVLMEIIAISGEYPATSLCRLIPSESYVKKVVAQLIGDNLIKLISSGGLKGYRLTPKGKRKLASDNPARFAGVFDGATDTNKMRGGYVRRLRLHSLAETCALMYGSGIEIFADAKPAAYNSDEPSGKTEEHNKHPPVKITTPCFYTSRELKGRDDNAIRGSRAVGTLLTPSLAYAVYNTRGTESRWSDKVEQRLKAHVQKHICRGLLAHQYNCGNGGEAGGIMIGGGMEPLGKLLAWKDKYWPSYNFMTKVFQPFYYITGDACGEALLRLLCDAGKMDGLRAALLKGMLPPDAAYPIEHDALTEDGNPVLFCCLPDIPRLIRFKNGTALHSKTGKAIAFDFQLDMLGSFLGDNAEFVSISFGKFAERFFNEP